MVPVQPQDPSANTFKTSVYEVKPIPVKTTDEQVVDLQPWKLTLLEFTVKTNQIVHTSLSSGPASMRLSTPDGLKDPEGGIRMQSSSQEGEPGPTATLPDGDGSN